jgi:hypothetical protein
VDVLRNTRLDGERMGLIFSDSDMVRVSFLFVRLIGRTTDRKFQPQYS